MRKLYVSFLILLVLSLTQKAIAQNPAVISEVEPNGTTATAQVLNLGTQNTTIVAGSVGVAGDLDWYRINGVAPGSKFWGYVDPGGTQNAGATSRDCQIRIFEADGTTLIEFDDDDGTGNGGDATIETTLASDIGGRTLTVGGTYYIQVKAFSATGIIDPYRLFVVVTPPALTAPEVESNNTAATANSIVTAAQTTGVFTGSISPAGDFDFYSVVATAGNIIYIVCDGDPARTGINTIDGVISLIAPDGTTILISADSDFGGANAAEGFSWNVITSGTYYVRVRNFSAAATGNYALMVSAAQGPTVVGCSGTPIAGTISGPATSCGNNSVTLTLSGHTNLPGITIEWKSATVSGGPYTNITGANAATYTFTPTTAGITYYIATVSCANGGASANTAQHTLAVGRPVYSALTSTVTTVCTPGTATFSGTVSGGLLTGAGVYVHTLTGPGTITQNASTGAGNSTGNFTVTNLPAGNHTFVLTSTDGIGCAVTTNVTALIKQTPIITFTPAAATICSGTIQQISAAVNPVTRTTFIQGGTTLIPAGSPLTTIGPANPYPSTIAVSGLPASGVTVKSVKLGNMNHTFPDDIDIVLVSPTGLPVVLMSDAGGGAGIAGLDYTLDDAAAALMADAALNPQGTYRPTNYGATDTYVAPGPGSVTQATPTLSTFTGNQNGTWNLYIVDDAGGDAGYMGNWDITFNIPSLVTFSPVTGLFTDPAATIAYTGTPVNVVYAKPAATTTFTGTSIVDGCTGTNTITVTVNQVPAITTQPTPATQTICPGFNVTYSVVATGTGLTYQWRLNAVALTNTIQYSGVNGPTLTIANVNAANSGNYDVVITGVCPPILTTTPVTLIVATAPVISTQPANTTVCAGVDASFSVATVGSSPAATIYQWQVSTDNGVTWSNLLVGGSFTPTLTVTGTTIAMNNYRYRVLVTNNCGQTTTSAAAILTVNALPTVTAGLLSNRICISDTLIGLTGTPVGGSWSGVGISGFNFVPTATALGTYNLTYSFTSTAGCTATATIVARVESCPERLRELDDDALIVYPNPSFGRINVRVNSTLYNYIGMKVYNAQGQLVNGKLNGGVLTSPTYGGLVYGRVIPIDLGSLPAGTYLVKFYYDDGQRTSEKGFKVVIAGH